MLNSFTVSKVQKVFRLMEIGDFAGSVTELRTSALADYFDIDLIDAYCVGLSSGNWEHLREAFLQNSFVNDQGLIFWIAPYRQLRNGKSQERVTGILGVAPVRTSYNQIRELAESNFGGNFHEISEIIGYRRITSCGLAGGKSGEAFLVPNGWQIGDVAHGVALNDMTEQYARIRSSEEKVRSILTPDNANLILDPVLDTIDGTSLQNSEFQYHEVAHGIGAGFAVKMKLGLFKSFHNCAVEEWRSDGISFSLMSELMDEETLGRHVAANIALRLSVDALRSGGFVGDHDAYATALSLQDMMRSKRCEIIQGKLCIHADSYIELAQVIDRQRANAWEVTKREIDSNGKLVHLTEVYSLVKLEEDSKALLNRLI